MRADDDGSTPGPIWRTLQEHFQGSSAHTVAEVMEQLTNLEMGKSLSLTTFIDRLNQCFTRLSANNQTMSDPLKSAFFLKGLEKVRYAEIKRILRAKKSLPTYVECCHRVIRYHKDNFGAPNELNGEAAGELIPSALQAGGNESKSNDTGNSRKCYNCNSTDHYAQDCTNPCGKCKQEGHISIACPNSKKKVTCTKCNKAGHTANVCKRDVTCSYCKKNGHHEHECHKKARDQKASAQVATNGPSEDTSTQQDIQHFGWLATDGTRGETYINPVPSANSDTPIQVSHVYWGSSTPQENKDNCASGHRKHSTRKQRAKVPNPDIGRPPSSILWWASQRHRCLTGKQRVRIWRMKRRQLGDSKHRRKRLKACKKSALTELKHELATVIHLKQAVLTQLLHKDKVEDTAALTVTAAATQEEPCLLTTSWTSENPYALLADGDDNQADELKEEENLIADEWVTTPQSLWATTPLTVLIQDSGCTTHLVNSPEGVINFQRSTNHPPISQAGQNAKGMEVIGTGTLHPWGEVKVVPTLRHNLISTSQLWREHKWKSEFSDILEIKDSKNGFKNVATGYLHSSGLYIIDNMPVATEDTANTAQFPSPLLEAHHKFGHLSLQGLRTLAQHGLLTEVTQSELKNGFGTCSSCVLGKQHKNPTLKRKTKSQRKRSQVKGEYVHTDVCGPMTVPTVGGARYFITYTCDCTSMTKVYLTKTKDALTTLKAFHQEILIPQGLRMRTLRHDGGGEYTSSGFTSLCRDLNIEQVITSRDSPWQNPIAERINRTLVEMASTQLIHAGMDKSWWGPSLLYAAYIRNRCPTAALNGGIPYIAWTGQKPNLDMLRPFGVTAYVHVPDTLRTKFDTKSIMGIFIGVDSRNMGYKIYIPSTRTIIHSRDVTFELDASGTREFFRETSDGLTDADRMAFGSPTVKSRSLPTKSRKDKTARDTQSKPMPTEEEGAVKMPPTVAEGDDTISNHQSSATNLQPGDQPVSVTPESASDSVQLHNVHKLKVSQLKLELKKRSLRTSGRKSELLQRLKSSMRENSPLTVPSVEQETKSEAEVDAVTAFKNSTALQCNQLFFEGYALLSSTVQLSTPSNNTGLEGITARSITTPTSYNEAMRSTEKAHWKGSIKKELDSLRQQSVYEVVDRPTDEPVLGTRWTFRIKELANGLIEKFKARFVAKGFLQQYLVNYFETYAPVARIETVRTIIAMARHLGWKIRQLDVNTAFLYGVLKETVYVEPPQGSGCPPGKVWKLLKALYGLKQAPKEWYTQLNSFMKKNGFTRLHSDQCVYVSHSQEGQVNAMVAIYVDDILVVAHNDALENKLVNMFKSRYNITDLGPLNWYVGMRVDQSDEATTISQELYTETVLERFKMSTCKSSPVPMFHPAPSVDDCPTNKEEAKAVQHHPYREAIGCLMYLSVCSRPDITTAVNKLAKYVSNPGLKHWQGILQVLRYLRGTTNYGLKYTNEGKPELTSFVDSSWANEDTKRHSTTGYLFKLGTSTVSWASYGQKSIARSSTEAEYMALSDASREAIWMARLVQECGIPQPPVVLFEDNGGCISLASSGGKYHKRTKHIDVRYHFVRQHIENGTQRVKYCKTEDMLADLLTKPLGRVRFARLRSLIGVIPIAATSLAK